jgi:hypothetical protein
VGWSRVVQAESLTSPKPPLELIIQQLIRTKYSATFTQSTIDVKITATLESRRGQTSQTRADEGGDGARIYQRYGNKGVLRCSP